MSESRTSLYKLFTWVLLATLIGVYALYHWYTGVLRQEVAQASEHLRVDADTEQGLKVRVADLEGRLAAIQGEHQTLTQNHASATAQVAALTEELDQRKQEIAAATAREQQLSAETQALGVQYEEVRKGLASKLNVAHKAWSESEAEHQAVKGHTKELEVEVGRLKHALAAADAKYAADAKDLEAKVEERTRALRTALEGSDPERAAQLAALQQQVQESRAALEQQAQQHQAALEQAEQAGQEAQSELADKLAAALQGADAQAQALAAAQEQHDGAMSEARGTLSALTEELASVRSDLAALEQKHEQTVAELRAELDQAGQTLADVRTELSSALAAAAQDKEAQEARIASLEQDLASERTPSGQAGQALAAQPKPSQDAPAADRPASAQAPTQTPIQGLPGQYAQLHARKTERGLLLSLPDQQLHFSRGVSTLPKGGSPSLDQIAALLKDSPQLTAVIEGHTDASGPDAVNLTLSTARAQAVRQGLIARGIAPERLTAQGLGETRPVGENASAAGRLKNRRVEVLVIEPAP